MVKTLGQTAHMGPVKAGNTGGLNMSYITLCLPTLR
jgi:hypothetical protein